MTKTNEQNWFEDIEAVITEPLKFKAKLAIGEDAYTSLRLKNAATKLWDTSGAAATGVVVAKSSLVASTFFAPSGLLAAIGIGTAVTPIGWLLAAGVVTGGAWVGVSRYIKGASASRVTVIPKFINTPMDALAVGLYDLIAPLALKVAAVDGHIDKKERNLISSYFVTEWGYDQGFVNEGALFIESKLSDFSIKDQAKMLAEFKKANPDCNYEPMSQEILCFITDIMEADGRINDREESAIEEIRIIFSETNQNAFAKTMKSSWRSVKDTAGNVLSDGIFPNKKT